MMPFTIAAYLFFGACTLSGLVGRGWDNDRTLPSVHVIYWMQIAASIALVIAVILFIILAFGLGR